MPKETDANGVGNNSLVDTNSVGSSEIPLQEISGLTISDDTDALGLGFSKQE